MMWLENQMLRSRRMMFVSLLRMRILGQIVAFAIQMRRWLKGGF
jgi:hypothetical protein